MASKSTQSYKDLRLADIAKRTAIGLNAYPHKFDAGDCELISTEECRSRYDHLEKGEHLEDRVALLGRVYSIRSSSKNLYFFDLYDGGVKVQIMANKKEYRGASREDVERTGEETAARNTELFRTITKTLGTGDCFGVCGKVCKTRLGELSIVPEYMEIVATCLHQVPRGERNSKHASGLTSLDTRYRQRYLDLMINDKTGEIFKTRSLIINYIRGYLISLGFLEVDTPIMDVMAGGATAKPFVTHSNDFNIPMYLRVAPELYLKRLVIGGLNKVFEIGRQFRNETNDLTHNCEFTSCEFYMRNADVFDLMRITEDMYRTLVTKIKQTDVIDLDVRVLDDKGKETLDEDGSPVTKTLKIDFSGSFQKIDMIPALEEAMGVSFPDPSTFGTEDARVFFDGLCTKNGVECSAPRTTARLLDKLVGHYIEPLCVNPTFIYGHPQIMSPLAKWDRDRPGLTERFELFINGMEYANAYTELNDPKVQMECFTAQDADRKSGDDEAQPVDTSYITAMEYGLPPTGGWGCGIDRLCMLLCNVHSIREVILFPTMKPIVKTVSKVESGSVATTSAVPITPPPVPTAGGGAGAGSTTVAPPTIPALLVKDGGFDITLLVDTLKGKSLKDTIKYLSALTPAEDSAYA